MKKEYESYTVFELDGEYESFNVGDEIHTKVTVRPIQYDGNITYTSSDESIATIDQNGVITILAEGVVTFKAKANELDKGTYKFLASEDELVVDTFKNHVYVDITVEDIPSEIHIGDTYKLNVQVTPTEYNGTITYSSSNPQILTVDNNGNLTAIVLGNATITITANDYYTDDIFYHGKSVTYEFEVSEMRHEVEYFTIGIANAEKDNLMVGQSYTFREINPQITSNLGNKYYVDDTVTINATVDYEGYEGQIYIASSDENVATIENGVITFKKLGDVTITISADAYTNGTIIVKPVTKTYVIRVKQKVQTVLVYDYKTGVLNAGSEVDLQVWVPTSQIEYHGVVHMTLSDNSLGTITVDNSKFPITAHLVTSSQNEGELIVYAQAEEYENDYYLFLASEKEAIANYINRIKEHVYVRGVPSNDKYYLYPNDTLSYNWTYTSHDAEGNTYIPREGWPSPVYTAGGLRYQDGFDNNNYLVPEKLGFDVSITSANNIHTAIIKPKGTHKVMHILTKVNEQDDYYIYHDRYASYGLAHIAAIDDLVCQDMLQIPDWNIWYRTSDNRKITLKSDESYTVTSHTYSNGLGKIAFKSNYGTKYVYIKILNQTNLTHIYFGNGFEYDGGIGGATNLQHMQLPNKETLVDMGTGVFEIGNLRTIVFNDTLPYAKTFELIFENPYSNAMVTTLFVPTKEVKKYSDTYFKVKSIDYQPE